MDAVFLGLSVVVGVGSGVAGHFGAGLVRQLLRALVVGCVGSILAVGFVAALANDFFALVHIGYLIGVVAVPLAAVIMLAASIWQNRRTDTRLGPMVLLVGLLPGFLGFYGTYIEPFRLRVDRHEVPTSPAGVRIGVLADLQTTSIGDYEKRALQTLVDENPDIVLLPGDFWQLPSDEKVKRRGEFQAAMAFLSNNIDHVFAVSGNTDTVAELETLTDGTDVVVLDNNITSVSVRGTPISVGGVTLFGEEDAADGVVDELVSRNEMGSELTILLGHKPDEVFRLDADQRVDLMVAGHTHGGQIRIPFFGPLITFSEVPRHVGAGGLHNLDGQPIYVSTGVGHEQGHAPQVRLGVRPSIGVLTATST